LLENLSYFIIHDVVLIAELEHPFSILYPLTETPRHPNPHERRSLLPRTSHGYFLCDGYLSVEVFIIVDLQDVHVVDRRVDAEHEEGAGLGDGESLKGWVKILWVVGVVGLFGFQDVEKD